MASTSLGIRDDLEERSADVCLPAEQEGTNWHWNTDYWRRLGAPWGGMFASVDDLLRLLGAFLHAGVMGDGRILSVSAARAMVDDQTAAMADLSEADRRCRRWGLGWRLGAWGELGSRRSFSHGGATGTLVGADPATGLSCAIFTTRPGAPLSRVVNAVQGSLIDG
jgi:CubicO group peptidase (beta-lactamase class C family)